MRIPSQFNDSSLYRSRRTGEKRRNRSPAPAVHDSRRKLFRLAVALILVIVVMNESRRPGLYQTFFADPEAGWTTVVENSSNASNASTDRAIDHQKVASANGAESDSGFSLSQNEVRHNSSEALDKETQTELDDKLDSLEFGMWVDSLEVPLQRAWIKTLVAIESESGLSSSAEPAAPGSTATTAISTEEISDSRQHLDTWLLDSKIDSRLAKEIQSGFDTMETFSSSGGSPPKWSEINGWATPMLNALDRAALSRVADGTFWTGKDSDAFYMQLARSKQLGSEGGVITGTLPLLQQPDVYQGERIRIVGTLGLAEEVAAKKNDFGIQSYWKLWVIPSDGGIRPTLLMTDDLPSSLSQHLLKDGTWNSPASGDNPNGELAAVGRFIKRLPYRSQVGADLAPVVIGRIVAVRSTNLASSTAAKGHSNLDGVSSPGFGLSNPWIGILFAVSLGVLIASVLVYRANADARRSRLLRMEGLATSVEALDSLHDPRGLADSNTNASQEIANSEREHE